MKKSIILIFLAMLFASFATAIEYSTMNKIVPVGNALASNFGMVLTKANLSYLDDDVVEFYADGLSEEYSYHEEIRFNASVALPASVQTGLTYSSPDEDWQDRVFIPLGAGSLGYYYEFDEALSTDFYISDATMIESRTLNFLGQDLVIFDAGSSNITVLSGNIIFLGYLESYTVEGKQLTLINVSSNGTALVDVDGTQDNIAENETKTINGLQVTNRQGFGVDEIVARSAELIAGTETLHIYTDGDEYIGEDADNPIWVWDLANLDSSAPTIGILFALNLDNFEETDNLRYNHTIYSSETVDFPDDFAQLKFNGLSQSTYESYACSEDIADLYNLYNDPSANVSSASIIRCVAQNQTDAGFVANGSSADTVYIYTWDNTTLNVYYQSPVNGKAVYAGSYNDGDELFELNYSSSTVSVTAEFDPIAEAMVMGNLTFRLLAGSDHVVMAILNSAPNEFTFTGYNDTDSDTGLGYYDGSTYTQLAHWTEDTRSKSGTIISDPATYFRTLSTLVMSLPPSLSTFAANISVSITSDSEAPFVNVNNPEDDSVESDNLVRLNFTITDDSEISSCWYMYYYNLVNGTNSSTANITISCIGDYAETDLTLYNGTYTFYVYSNDTFNNIAVGIISNVVVNDGAGPTITINKPTANTRENDSIIVLNFTVTDASGVDECYYMLNYSLVNGTNSSTSNTTVNCSTGAVETSIYLYNGTYNIHVFSSDAVMANVGSSVLYNVSVADSARPTPSGFSTTTTSSTATIQWAADEPSTMRMDYGLSQSNLNLNSINSDYATSGSFALSGLTASTRYHYTITACDYNNNCRSTGYLDFNTTASSGSPGGSGSSSSPDKPASQSAYVNFQSKTNAEVRFTNKDIALEKIALTPATPRSAVLFTAAVRTTVNNTYAGRVYQYIELTHTAQEFDVSDIKISFRAAKSWMNSTGLSKDQVVLKRYTTRWTELVTRFLSEDSLYAYFEADSPGLSLFAVAEKEAVSQPDSSPVSQPVVQQTPEPAAPTPEQGPQDGVQVTDDGTSSDEGRLSNNTGTTVILVLVILAIVAMAIGVYFKNNKKK